MYGRNMIRFAINKSVNQSTTRLAVHPSINFFSSTSTQSNRKKPNFIDDIRESASGLPQAPSSSTYDRVNVVKTTTSPSSSTFDRRENEGDVADFVADTAKQGVVKAVETGLGIGEMGKKTLDNVWDAAKDTTHAVKEAVAGDDEKKNDAPADDQYVNGLRKHAGWYDMERNK